MKRMMLAWIVVSLAGMVSAVPMAWDWKPVEPVGNARNECYYLGGGSITYSEDFAVKATVALGGLTGGAGNITAFAVGQGTDNFKIMLNTTASGESATFTLGSAGTGSNGKVVGADSTFTYIPGEEKTLFTFMLTYDASEQTMSAYINDQLLGRRDYSESGMFLDGSFNQLTLGTNPNDGNTVIGSLVEVVYTDSAYGLDQGNLMYSTELLPEPTVLALLAFGVAGVALRRRVAA